MFREGERPTSTKKRRVFPYRMLREREPLVAYITWSSMAIEEFKDHQAEEVSELIRQDLLEIISKDYPQDYLASLLDHFTPANIRATSKTQHIFVAVEDGRILGTASLANYGSQAKPKFYGTSVFVALEFQRRGVGKQLMKKVETKAKELGAEMVTIRAAVGARDFYRKLGYKYQNHKELPDEKGNYIMEKLL